MATPSPIEQFDNLVATSDFVFLVFYRGHWCPFCRTYLSTLQTLQESITAAHGTVLTVTAEGPDKLEIMRAKTGYTGLMISDPANELAAELKKRDLLDVAITLRSDYEHGMAQPAVLVLKKDGTVLFHWAIVPALMNLGGAKDRPSLTQIWENVEAQLGAKPVVHEKFQTLSISQVIGKQVLGW